MMACVACLGKGKQAGELLWSFFVDHFFKTMSHPFKHLYTKRPLFSSRSLTRSSFDDVHVFGWPDWPRWPWHSTRGLKTRFGSMRGKKLSTQWLPIWPVATPSLTIHYAPESLPCWPQYGQTNFGWCTQTKETVISPTEGSSADFHLWHWRQKIAESDNVGMACPTQCKNSHHSHRNCLVFLEITRFWDNKNTNQLTANLLWKNILFSFF